MNAIKIENFKRTYPGRQFPWFESLSPSEAESLRTAIVRKVGLQEDVDPLRLVLHIEAIGEVLPELNAEDDGFNVRAALETLGIKPCQSIYINWYRFDDIDRIMWEEFATYFDDIWYPSSDDIEVFDDSLSWILVIAHYGELKSVRLTSQHG